MWKTFFCGFEWWGSVPRSILPCPFLCHCVFPWNYRYAYEIIKHNILQFIHPSGHFKTDLVFTLSKFIQEFYFSYPETSSYIYSFFLIFQNNKKLLVLKFRYCYQYHELRVVLIFSGSRWVIISTFIICIFVVYSSIVVNSIIPINLRRMNQDTYLDTKYSACFNNHSDEDKLLLLLYDKRHCRNI